MIYSCCKDNRTSLVLKNKALNGINYLDVIDTVALKLKDSPPQQTLLIHCLNPLTQASWSPANVVISGGESITQVGILWVAPAGAAPAALPGEKAYFNSLPDKANVIVVRTAVAGDFSTYTLSLVNNAVQAALDPFAVTEVLAGFDPQLAQVDFSFKVECGPDFDCAPPVADCPPNLPPPPPINYLAKDYGSFRSIILDRLNQLLPAWGATSEADLGITLAEVMAYVGDQLSYQQDAVATEAYLETARLRVSLRRHALLVDYHVHDGCNARVWMQLAVVAPATPGTPVVLDRTKTKFYTTVPGMPASLAGPANEAAALNAGVQIFEPMQDADLYFEHNQINFYTWGDTGCCLPQGATEATLAGSLTNLKPGDVLVFQEVIGPQTGFPADADLRHRCAVRLTQVATRNGQGNLLQDTLFPGAPVGVTEIQWAEDDALPFPLCISSNYIASDGTTVLVANVSVAFGNVVLADHGLTLGPKSLGTVPQPSLFWPPNPATDRCNPQPPSPLPVSFMPVLADSPITQAVPLPLAGIPVTPGIVALAGVGYISLSDATGLVSLLVQSSQPADWPLSIGVAVSANAAVPANIDLKVCYMPAAPSVPAAPVILEAFTNLSLAPADPNYAGAQINSLSQLIQVPAAFTPPTTPLDPFPATPTMLQGTAVTALNDTGSPATTFLEVQATNPMGWPSLFGVMTQANLAVADGFNLVVFYNSPLGGVGVSLPVTAGVFTGLTAASAAGVFGLVRLMSFADAPNAGLSASDLMGFDPDAAVPVIALTGQGPQGTAVPWTPVQDLLGSEEMDTEFVVEIESDGTATLRFGDDTNGYAPVSGASFTASYRVGNGTAGNVGADIIVNLANPNAQILGCRNPLPATGGTDPETCDQIRRRAPQAFQTQERAVTMADYQALTEQNSQVDRAAASLRWTGSWYTVFVAVEPKGGGPVPPSLETTLTQGLEAYRLAGQDLQLDSPQYVSLQITLQVCVDPDYFQRDVEQALLQVLSNRILPNGQKGVFYPDNFTFGQTVYLSPVYAAARSVAGVTSVLATVFQPQGAAPTQQYISSGELILGSTQVARLDNDRSYPDHGQLVLIMEGGKV